MYERDCRSYVAEIWKADWIPLIIYLKISLPSSFFLFYSYFYFYLYFYLYFFLCCVVVGVNEFVDGVRLER